MISEKMQRTINKQINAELYSSYLYLSMSAYYESINLKGFANWMRVQAQEELTHATMFFDYLNERGGRVTLMAIENPPAEWDAPKQPFKDAYQHETKVTAMINDMVDLAISEKDHASNSFLKWFVDEQVEEEASADAVVKQLELIGDGNGLFMLDRELGQRVFTPPAATGGEGAA